MKRQEQDKLWKTGRTKKITKFSDKEIERKLVCLFAVLIASVFTRNWLALFAPLFKHTSEKPVWRKETGEDEETHGGSGGLICRLLLPCCCGQDSGKPTSPGKNQTEGAILCCRGKRHLGRFDLYKGSDTGAVCFLKCSNLSRKMVGGRTSFRSDTLNILMLFSSTYHVTGNTRLTFLPQSLGGCDADVINIEPTSGT
ncbi:hypothetical protein RRG08_005879 [Elysia crispata]|uniref:Uncharacterized protein n=1 Tax=Elysia crispata TaxID=231223 RepID=A0AAE0ZV22_9GAST|nr:hypothetical protein RRG08_005879 [Elysia crispata]